MNTGAIILLVENNIRERENFLQMALQQGWNTTTLESSYEAIQWLKKNGPAQLVVISENAAPLNAHQSVNYIKNELKLEIPVVISQEGSKDTGNADTGELVYIISKPFDEQHPAFINNILSQHYREPEEKEKAYSLNYLESVSEGNKDFILECLEVFKTSVKNKLAQLDEAVNNHDYKAIGEIAHNIKPSFEMLENNISRDICNKLTYNVNEQDVQALVDKLKAEFKEINKQLERDMPHLK